MLNGAIFNDDSAMERRLYAYIQIDKAVMWLKLV
jgi:hypothetical protein